jgi:acetoin utilization deacetylase AcuC-like enzyme
LKAHTQAYVEKVRVGPFTDQDEREMGFCWSETLFTRGATIVGCSLAATHEALSSGIGLVLGGGAHHAFADRGRGFCIFNDIACVAIQLLDEGRISKIGVLDCDVHQGDGTASLLSGRPGVYTCSIHGANNYPFRKMQSTLDIELPDECGDAAYLDAVQCGIEQTMQIFRPDLLIYVAGADPYEEDRLGRLKVSAAALAERDRQVFEQARQLAVPILTVFGGGYCDPIEKTVEVNLATIRVALECISDCSS